MNEDDNMGVACKEKIDVCLHSAVALEFRSCSRVITSVTPTDDESSTTNNYFEYQLG